MRCSSCKFDNPDAMKFCGRCGTMLSQGCSTCGFDNPAEFKFCGQCGGALTRSADDAAPSSTQPTAVRLPDGERRQLTVMFCDLIGSTSLSERLDPEDLRELMQVYRRHCVEVIDGFHGHIAKYLGDGILAYFGYPHAHEDDAHRAVRAGLGIVGGIPAINEQFQRLSRHASDVELAVRVGIHTGLVVSGDMGHGEFIEREAIVGETPNIAARLQDLAPRNSVVISHGTRRLCHDLFQVEDMGLLKLKGITRDMRVYTVIDEADPQTRLAAAAKRGITPLVGRQEEAERLFDAWQKTKDGLGQLVLLGGEAGIGKSRLVYAVRERVQEQPHTAFECRCSPHYGSSAFHAITESLQRTIGFAREDSPDEKIAKLNAFVSAFLPNRDDVTPLFAELFSLPLNVEHASTDLSPERRRMETMDALVHLYTGMAAQDPLFFLVEDLQWIDPSTLEFLSLLVDRLTTHPIMALFTYRPGFRPPWKNGPRLTSISLARLNTGQMQSMVQHLVGGKSLPTEVLTRLIAKTDGVPLFVEELTKMVIESGLFKEEDDRYELVGSLPAFAIPSTLRDSLMARLDRLATAKEIAQLGASIGREFPFELICEVASYDENHLEQELGRLVEANLLDQRGIPPQATYTFRHALIQDAAYESLLRSTRRRYHAQIANALAERFPKSIETQPEILAHHYTEGGEDEKALELWERAARLAFERSAHREAVNHLRNAARVVDRLPEGEARDRHDLLVQATLGLALSITRGYSAPPVEEAYRRARELCERVGRVSKVFFRTVFGLWGYYFLRGELRTAWELADQCLKSSNDLASPTIVVSSHVSAGGAKLWLGEFATARKHLDRGLALYTPPKGRSDSLGAFQDPGVSSGAWGALAIWFLGYPDLALKRGRDALSLARSQANPVNQAFALFFTGVLHQLCRQTPETHVSVNELIAISREQAMPFWSAMGTGLQGWVLVQQGQAREGITQVQRCLQALDVIGTNLGKTHFLGYLAEAYREAGQIDEGLRTIDDALAMVDDRDEHLYESELHRLRGEMLLIRTGDDDTEAAASLRTAIEIATRQEAKSLVLRSTMSLSKLLVIRGEPRVARKQLEAAYNDITEGFRTRDLQDAKAMLERLE